MVYAKLIKAFRDANEHWPDVLLCDPVCIHHIGFELAYLEEFFPDLPAIRIAHSQKLPAGTSVPLTLTEYEHFLLMSEFATTVYEPHFHPEAFQ